MTIKRVSTGAISNPWYAHSTWLRVVSVPLALTRESEHMREVFLTKAEVAELDKQDPATRGDGGFQGLMVSLQEKVNRASGALLLTDDDLRRIPMYAFDYRNGGWEDRLIAAFGRTLGTKLGR